MRQRHRFRRFDRSSQKSLREISETGLSFQKCSSNVVHSSAIISCNAEILLGRRIQIIAGAVINARTIIGENSIVNTRGQLTMIVKWNSCRCKKVFKGVSR